MLASRLTGTPAGIGPMTITGGCEDLRQPAMQHVLQRPQRVRHIAIGDGDRAAHGRAVDHARHRIAEDRVASALLRPQQLLDRCLEHPHAGVDRWVLVERAEAVVEQEGRGRPDADERRRPGIAASTGRHVPLIRLAGERIIHGDVADRRQVLVVLRREIIPDIAAQRIGGERTARVGLQQRHRHAELCREEVAVEEIRRVHDGPHLAA